MESHRHAITIELALLVFMLIFLAPIMLYAQLNCKVAASCMAPSVSVANMSYTTNAHAELPGQSYPYYICCNSVTGSTLTNICSGNYQAVFALSDTTNAHVEVYPSPSGYATTACLGSTTIGDKITIGYESGICIGYDDTLASMSSIVSNAHIGNETAYGDKICGTLYSQSISFSIDDNTIGFGPLSYSGTKYATGDTLGSGIEVVAHNLDASTSALYGYTITVLGGTLSSSIGDTITAIGPINTLPSIGDEQFGIRGEAVGGTGVVEPPYSAAGFAYDATVSSPDVIATESAGDGVNTTYEMRYMSNIDELTESSNYDAVLTYVMTANY